MDWIKKLKVGDRVVVRVWSPFGSTHYPDFVKRKTPTGRVILEKGDAIFDTDGVRRGSKGDHPPQLWEYSPELWEKAQREQALGWIQNSEEWLQPSGFDTEALLALEAALRGFAQRQAAKEAPVAANG